MPCITMSSFLVSRLSYRFPLGTILISAFLPLFILFPITLNTYNHHSAYLSPTSFRDNLRFYLFQDAFPNYSTIILAIPEISQGCIFLSHLNTSRIMQNYFMYPFPPTKSQYRGGKDDILCYFSPHHSYKHRTENRKCLEINT